MSGVRNSAEVNKRRHDLSNVSMAFQKVGNGHCRSSSESTRKLKYLIVIVDYFTKWLEAKPVANITGRQVKNFSFDNIVCRFGVPAIIITDNGTQLINNPFKSWAEGLEIKLISTYVYHSQVMERWNGKHNAGYQDKVAPRRSRLGRGIIGLILAEIGMPTRRTAQRTDEENDIELRLNLNLLEERREITIIREARRKQQVERKNEVSKAENTGKLGQKWEGPYEVIETYDTGAHKLRTMDGAEVPRTWHSSNLRKYYM
ncbi:reverse transcriptase domain-containing protein [Tanacetum coccineum]